MTRRNSTSRKTQAAGKSSPANDKRADKTVEKDQSKGQVAKAFRYLSLALGGLWFALFRVPMFTVALVISAVFTMFLLSMTILNTPRDVAYRGLDPATKPCAGGASIFHNALARSANDESAAIQNQKDAPKNLEEYLRCSIQRHTIFLSTGKEPRSAKPNVDYSLAFVELTEVGAPVEFDIEGREVGFNQLRRVLEFFDDHKDRQHYVIAFVHGWRHDARIGDGDVARLRIYAAYADSFLKQRCREKHRYCGAKVTAVYLGWRGARISERTWIGTLLGLTTLFDRKPVSEKVGPAIVAALKAVSRKLRTLDLERNAGDGERSRMVSLGHSLGGNALAFALKDEMISIVRRHEAGRTLSAPFGDLIVLLNPASEAINWTSIQHETRNRLSQLSAYASHKFYPISQKPIYVAFTSANSWPAGGFRAEDRRRIGIAKLKRRGDYVPYPAYDWATHDMFPAFRGDFRPAGETLERLAEKQRWLRCRKDLACHFGEKKEPENSVLYKAYSHTLEWILQRLANIVRNLPFQNTDVEKTRTIGHIHPLRTLHAPYGNNQFEPATVLGATHEFIVNDRYGKNTAYENAANLKLSECAVADEWLYRARAKKTNGTKWDSGFSKDDALLFAQNSPDNVLRIQFRHSLVDSRTEPIVRANDPFWNVRAHQTAMKGHDAPTAFPFICAMHQLVMDSIIEKPSEQVFEGPSAQ